MNDQDLTEALNERAKGLTRQHGEVQLKQVVFSAGLDHSGDPAVFVDATIESAQDREWTTDLLRPVKSAIRDVVEESDQGRLVYFTFWNPGERDSLESEAAKDNAELNGEGE